MKVAALAERQHRLVRADQLAALGWDKHAVRRRVRAGSLHRVGRGVLSVGAPSLTREGRWLAAVWSCGPGAVLSHRDAAALWQIRHSARRLIDVTTPSRNGRTAPQGVDLHRTRRLEPHEVTEQDGIPLTTPARTLADLADVLGASQYLRAVHEAEYLRLHAPPARIPGRRNPPGNTSEPQLTRNALELSFLELIRQAGLPPPKVNFHVHTGTRLAERDFVWPDLRLIAEVDGYDAHTTHRAFEADRRTDAELVLEGWIVLRFTWRQVTDETTWVKESLARARKSRA